MKADIYKTITLTIETQDIRIMKYIVLLAEKKINELKGKTNDPAIKLFGDDVAMISDIMGYISDLKEIIKS